MITRVVGRTERGWAGHFICANSCGFRRNTLLHYKDIRVVVSTVGAMRENGEGKMVQIGYKRWYETMIFHAKKEGRYWDADVSRQYYYHGDTDWSVREEGDKDQEANDMHEAIVLDLIKLLEDGDKLENKED